MTKEELTEYVGNQIAKRVVFRNGKLVSTYVNDDCKGSCSTDELKELYNKRNGGTSMDELEKIKQIKDPIEQGKALLEYKTPKSEVKLKSKPKPKKKCPLEKYFTAEQLAKMSKADKNVLLGALKADPDFLGKPLDPEKFATALNALNSLGYSPEQIKAFVNAEAEKETKIIEQKSEEESQDTLAKELDNFVYFGKLSPAGKHKILSGVPLEPNLQEMKDIALGVISDIEYYGGDPAMLHDPKEVAEINAIIEANKPALENIRKLKLKSDPKHLEAKKLGLI